MLDAAGRPVPHGEPVRLLPGQVEAVSPAVGDIHRVNNAHDDRVSISIHVYGANIGAVRRSVYAEDAVFASPSGLTRGRALVLERYQKKYPDAAARGTLSFDVLETRLASGVEVSFFGDALPSDVHGVSVLARWALAYPEKPTASGLTLLVLRRRGNGWEIVQDASM